MRVLYPTGSVSDRVKIFFGAELPSFGGSGASSCFRNGFGIPIRPGSRDSKPRKPSFEGCHPFGNTLEAILSAVDDLKLDARVGGVGCWPL